LSNPSQAIRAGTRTYELFYEGEQLRTVAWREGGATYWVQNTLTHDLSPREMLAIAEQTTPVVSASPARAPGTLSLRSVRRPWRTRGAALLLAGAAAALIGGGSYLLARGGSSSPAPARAAAPVAVLRATGSAGAAHSIAVALRAGHVRVARVGAIKNANLGHGNFVLYPPGSERQARALARLIPGPAPTVMPLGSHRRAGLGPAGEDVIMADGPPA